MPETPGTITVVLDTTVVIHLAKANRPEILGKIEGYAFSFPTRSSPK